MALYTIEVQNHTGRSQWGVNVPDGSCVVVCALARIAKVNKKWRLQHEKIVKRITERDGSYGGRACIVYSLVQVIGKSSRVDGKDQWGLFYEMTGCEAIGACFWCGKTPIRGRYCTERHGLMYKRHFNWAFARDWCWIRYANHCGLCDAGKIENPIDWRWRTLEVHHIEPLNAGFRDWTLLNRPENLILLCPPCHDLTRRKDFMWISKAIVDTNQLMLI